MIIVVAGPTGVGKTKMSIELAKKYNGIVINADAVQVYKKLDIGSAKVTEDEKENIPHFLFDIKNPDEDYNVKDYQDDLRKLIEENKDKNIIIVGGTGLYITAGLFDYRFSENESDETYDNISNEELYKLALKKDENIDIHPNNRVRLIRFLNKKKEEIVKPTLLYPNTIFIGLTTDRDNLYKIIDNRVDKMFENGLLNEVETLYKDYPKSRVLHSAIGYKETIDYLDKKISLEETKNLIKKNSRHYAKRQYTWFNNKLNINWFNVNYNNFKETINEVNEYIKSQNL